MRTSSNAARDIHAEDPAFGYRFIADELTEKGITAGENRAQHLCRDHGIWSVFSKKRGLNRRPGQSVHDDPVERDFAALESFFSLLQKNVLDRHRWLTRQYPDWPSQSGSKEPTTADDGKDGWDNTRPPNMKQSTEPRS